MNELFNSVVLVVLGALISLIPYYFQVQESKRKERVLFLTEVSKKLADCYGEIRKYLYLEAAPEYEQTPQDIAELAKLFGIFTGLSLTINNPEITEIVKNELWIPRDTQDAKGKVQSALEKVLLLIQEIHNKEQSLTN